MKTVIKADPERQQLGPSALVPCLLVAMMPFYRILPHSGQAVWILLLFVTLIVAICIGNVARPLFATSWILSTALAIGALLILFADQGIRPNVVAGSQMVALFSATPFVLAYLYQHRENLAYKMSSVFVLAQCVSSLTAIIQLGGSSVLGQVAAQGRAPGLAGHPNLLGTYASIAIYLCVHVALTRNGPVRVFSLVAVTLNFAALLASGSLSALSAGAIGLVLLLWTSRVKLTRVVWAVALISGFFALVISLSGVADKIRTPLSRYLQVTGQTKAASTLEIRGETIDFAWEHIKLQPFFGVGLTNGGTFDGITVTHNILLRSWYQGGILLFLAVALIYATAVLAIIRCVLRRQAGLQVAILASIVAYSMTSAMLEQPNYWLPLIAAWCALAPETRVRKRFSENLARSGPGDRDPGGILQLEPAMAAPAPHGKTF